MLLANASSLPDSSPIPSVVQKLWVYMSSCYLATTAVDLLCLPSPHMHVSALSSHACVCPPHMHVSALSSHACVCLLLMHVSALSFHTIKCNFNTIKTVHYVQVRKMAFLAHMDNFLYTLRILFIYIYTDISIYSICI